MNKEHNLIEQIQSGNQKAVEKIYTQYKSEFLGYAARFAISKDEVLDIYQDSVVVFYENIVSGKLTSLTSSIKTYLFAIGKYKIYNRLKVKVPTKDVTDFEFLLKEENNTEFSLQEENIEKLQQAYKNLGCKCKEVLKLFYYQNRSIESIKESLGYASKDVVKSQKSRCVKQLKELMLELK